jgi:hypothetical protein
MFRYLVASLALAALMAWPAAAQETGSRDDNFDVRSSVGDLHVGKDADAQKAGFPLYPGARPKHEKDNDPLNLGILTEAFGIKLVVAKYESDDAPDKIVSFYRDKLKKYGKVLECHSRKNDEHLDVDDDKKGPKELKCEGDNTGPVTELKVGTEDHGHFVSIEPGDKGKGSTFALVYVYARGKQGDI